MYYKTLQKLVNFFKYIKNLFGFSPWKKKYTLGQSGSDTRITQAALAKTAILHTHTHQLKLEY